MKKYNTNLFGQKLNASQAIDSNAEGRGNITRNIGENANGTFNVSNTGSEDSKKTIHSIGIGTKDSDRSNALEIMQNGDIYLYGVGGYEGDNASDSKSIQSVIQDSQSGGDYTLPIASADTLGGIKVGEGLNIDEEGVLSSTSSGVGQIYPDSDGTGEIFNDYTNNKATGTNAHAEGYDSRATGDQSHAEGGRTTAEGATSHAEGVSTIARGLASHTEGSNTITNNDYEHAQGKYNNSNRGSTDSDKTIHSIGIGASSSSRKNAVEVMQNGDVYINGVGSYDGTNYADAQTLQEIVNSQSGGGVGKVDPHSGGTGEIFNYYGTESILGNSATGIFAHAEGYYTSASGYYSHAEGYSTTAAAYGQHAMGRYNTTVPSESHLFYSVASRAFIIGNGSSDGARGDAFYVLFNGETHADGAFTNDGADYAEMFEWEDGNTDNEDRVGLFVTLDGDKIRTATSDDIYILGIVSGAPGVIGNNPMRWKDKYLNDEWGRPVYEIIEQDIKIPMDPTDEGYDPESNVQQTKTVKQSSYVRKLNPEWNCEIEYSLRSSRKEWASIGLMGQMLVRQDGTLVQGKFCKVNENGMATASDTGYYVMHVNNEGQALILFK